MKITTMPYIWTTDDSGVDLMRPALPGEDPVGTWFVFTDELPSGEEFGVMLTYTEVLTEPPDHILDTVERMMATYRSEHG